MRAYSRRSRPSLAASSIDPGTLSNPTTDRTLGRASQPPPVVPGEPKTDNRSQTSAGALPQASRDPTDPFRTARKPRTRATPQRPPKGLALPPRNRSPRQSQNNKLFVELSVSVLNAGRALRQPTFYLAYHSVGGQHAARVRARLIHTSIIHIKSLFRTGQGCPSPNTISYNTYHSPLFRIISLLSLCIPPGRLQSRAGVI